MSFSPVAVSVMLPSTLNAPVVVMLPLAVNVKSPGVVRPASATAPVCAR